MLTREKKNHQKWEDTIIQITNPQTFNFGSANNQNVMQNTKLLCLSHLHIYIYIYIFLAENLFSLIRDLF